MNDWKIQYRIDAYLKLLARYPHLANSSRGQLPITTDRELLLQEQKRLYQMADENFANTVITPVPLTAPDFSSLVNEQIDQIMLGSKTPAEGLADAQKAVEDLVEQNK